MSDKIADKAEVFRGEDNQWYVRTLSSNGEKIMVSEGYVSSDHAMHVAADTGLPVEIVDSFLTGRSDNG